MSCEEKILPLSEIVARRVAYGKEGKSVVTTNGSYDILHAGHIKSLEESKAQGDVLIVGINSDHSVRQYKSPDRPIVPEGDRALIVAALACVDHVFVFDELDPIEFITQLKPDVHTNSSDYGQDCVEAPAVRAGGGRLHLLKKYDGLSTSEVIEKILSVYCKEKKEVV